MTSNAVLDHARTIDFKENVGIKGRGIGANAFFLLPSLELDTIVCIGQPSDNDFEALRFFASQIIITGTSDYSESVMAIKDIQSESVDFVYVISLKFINQAEIQRILKPEACVYYEYYGEDKTGLETLAPNSATFWITPNWGAMQTAVPVSHTNSMTFIRTSKLYTASIASIRNELFDSWRRRLSASKPSKAKTVLPNTSSTSTLRALSKNKNAYIGIVKKVLKRIRELIVGSAFVLEQVVLQTRLGKQKIMRIGRLMLQNQVHIASQIPAYIQAIATKDGVDLSEWQWLYLAKGDYGSQKLLFFLFQPEQSEPSILVKMVRHPQYNGRLEREQQGLIFLQQSNFAYKHTIPSILFSGYHRNLKVIAETVHHGRPFHTVSSLDENCNYAHFVVDWMIELGQSTCKVIGGAELEEILIPFYEEFVDIYNPDNEQKTFLKAQLETLKGFNEIPLVFRHGDPGIHNYLITASDTVVFLDWENAEQNSMPLWDLFYFFSSFTVSVGEIKSGFTRLEAYRKYFLDESNLSDFILESIRNYARSIGVDDDLIVPLYYIFWMYQALKQATLIRPERLYEGHNWSILQMSLSQRDAFILKKLRNNDESLK